MVVLKRIMSSSLIETLIASVIIITVFMIASISFINIFSNELRAKDDRLQSRIREIKYYAKYDQLNYPFYEERKYWIISGVNNISEVEFLVKNKRTNSEKKIKIAID